MGRVTLAVSVVCLLAGSLYADIEIEMVSVGNPGNVGEGSGRSYGGYGPDRICGAVGYAYNIGKYEVTAAQYTEFLNAVANTDTYELYREDMWSHPTYGCRIERSGLSGSYSYSVAADWANRPVTYVSWGDAARFANWLTNGQPVGVQDLTTTEDGSYYLNGAMSFEALMAVTRKASARYVIPSEDEWYKAAYHKNDGVTGDYWDYPTGTDATPSNQLLDPDPGNNANYYLNGHTIGSPYYRTEVGSFENSESPYGTFDQGGNVWEWNEAVMSEVSRGERGGSFRDSGVSDDIRASVRSSTGAAINPGAMGFRVAEVSDSTVVPLPSAFWLGAVGLGLVGWIKRGRGHTPSNPDP